MRLVVRPVTAERWPDLVDLFGPNGAYANCWCTWWRRSAKDFDAGCRQRGAANRTLLQQLVHDEGEPGLLAYDGERAVGWVSVAPLTEFPRVLRSPTLKPGPDDDPSRIWSINCFVVRRDARGAGVASTLLTEAMRYASVHGARVVEGYPVDTATSKMSAADLYTGTLAMFESAGFRSVPGRTGKRVLVRRTAPKARPRSRT